MEKKAYREKFSLRVNTHKMLYSILKGLEIQLFDAQTLFLNVPTKPRRKGDWTPENIITFMLEGGFHPLARDFPEEENKYFRMIFMKAKLVNDEPVIKQYENFLTREAGSDSKSKKAKRKQKA